MNIITSCKKGCGQLLSNDTFFYDSCFGGLKTACEESSEGLYHCGLVKMSQKGFLIAMLVNIIERVARSVSSWYAEYSNSSW